MDAWRRIEQSPPCTLLGEAQQGEQNMQPLDRFIMSSCLCRVCLYRGTRMGSLPYLTQQLFQVSRTLKLAQGKSCAPCSLLQRSCHSQNLAPPPYAATCNGDLSLAIEIRSKCCLQKYSIVRIGARMASLPGTVESFSLLRRPFHYWITRLCTKDGHLNGDLRWTHDRQ